MKEYITFFIDALKKGYKNTKTGGVFYVSVSGDVRPFVEKWVSRTDLYIPILREDVSSYTTKEYDDLIIFLAEEICKIFKKHHRIV